MEEERKIIITIKKEVENKEVFLNIKTSLEGKFMSFAEALTIMNLAIEDVKKLTEEQAP